MGRVVSPLVGGVKCGSIVEEVVDCKGVSSRTVKRGC